MLSKEMYRILALVPRYPKSLSYKDMNPTDDQNVYHLIAEAAYQGCDFLNEHGQSIKNSEFSLTEKGQVAIEQYEQNEENNRIVAQSLKVAEESLKVAIVAKRAAIASAIAAFLSLLPVLINFLNTLFTKQ